MTRINPARLHLVSATSDGTVMIGMEQLREHFSAGFFSTISSFLENLGRQRKGVTSPNLARSRMWLNLAKCRWHSVYPEQDDVASTSEHGEERGQGAVAGGLYKSLVGTMGKLGRRGISLGTGPRAADKRQGG
jgi:hypothetical protein